MRYAANFDVKFMYRSLRYYFPSFVRFKVYGAFFLQQNVGCYFLVGKRTVIEKYFNAGVCCFVGSYSYIGPNVSFGNFVMMSDYISIIGNDHVSSLVGVPIILSGRPKNYSELKTSIEDDVWIGRGVTIMRGVTIGEGAIVGANSVVTKDIPPYTVYAGSPAKFIKVRFSEEDAVRHSFFLKEFRKGGGKLLHDRKPIFSLRQR